MAATLQQPTAAAEAVSLALTFIGSCSPIHFFTPSLLHLSLICPHAPCINLIAVRIVLSNIGTYGDVHPLIAIALELRRRGHTPVMALPNLYRAKIEPLGLEFRPIRPDIDPTNTAHGRDDL